MRNESKLRYSSLWCTKHVYANNLPNTVKTNNSGRIFLREIYEYEVNSKSCVVDLWIEVFGIYILLRMLANICNSLEQHHINMLNMRNSISRNWRVNNLASNPSPVCEMFRTVSPHQNILIYGSQSANKYTKLNNKIWFYVPKTT